MDSEKKLPFTSSECVAELRAHDIPISMDGRGRCLDNARMERFRRALKYEDIKIKEHVSLPQLRFGVQHYVNVYNSTRIHTLACNAGCRTKPVSELAIGKL